MKDNVFKEIFPFETPRKLQRTVIEKTIKAYKDGYKHVVINAPTGIGKSIIGIAVANYLHKQYSDGLSDAWGTYVLTSQKSLQAQYANDFNLPLLKGRDNYPCHFYSDRTKANGPCSLDSKYAKAHDCVSVCGYMKARTLAYSSPITVLNYSYFLAMANTSLAFGIETAPYQSKRNLLILDEVHNVERIAVENECITINNKTLFRIGLTHLSMKIPTKRSSLKSVYNWLLNKLMPEAYTVFLNLSNLVESITHPKESDRKLLQNAKLATTLYYSLKAIEEALEEGKLSDFILCFPKKGVIEIKQMFGKATIKSMLTDFSNITLNMSATVSTKASFCAEMGYDINETYYLALPSLFDVKNRQIVSTDKIGNMSFKEKAKTLPKMVKAVERILEKYDGQSGIIHTASYEVAEYIMEHISAKQRKRLVMPRAETRDKQLQHFYDSIGQGKVLISPSLAEGVDLKGDLSKFTVICKVPYPYLGDEWISARLENSGIWYSNQTINTLVQMYGRSVRTTTDKAMCYILDAGFKTFYKRNSKMFPKWFVDALNVK